MRKFVKVICCLILPIVTMFCFSGCSKDRTKDDIANKLSSIRASYVVGDDKNEFFDDLNLLNVTYLNKEMSDIYDPTEFNADNFANDKNLYNRYCALMNIQHRVLNASLIYYVNMSEHLQCN